MVPAMTKVVKKSRGRMVVRVVCKSEDRWLGWGAGLF